jgi:hypothetical protein
MECQRDGLYAFYFDSGRCTVCSNSTGAVLAKYQCNAWTNDERLPQWVKDRAEYLANHC